MVKHPVAGEELFSMYTRIFLSRTTGLIEMIEKASGLPIEESGLLTRCTIDFVRRGNVLPPGVAETAEVDRLILEATMAKFFTNHDVWLTPVTPHMPTTSTDWLSSHPFDEQRTQRSMGSLPIANAIGGPAMSVPLWWDKNTGLPIGSHFQTRSRRNALRSGLPTRSSPTVGQPMGPHLCQTSLTVLVNNCRTH
jgi:amidase